MSHLVMRTLVALLGAAALAGAQTPSTSSEQAKPEKTYSGCVQAGTAAGAWVLANASEVKPAAPVGTAGTTPSAAEKKTYTLAGSPADVDLKSHMGHKVEITGTLADAPASPSATPSASGTAQQQLNVKSLKMVSSTCP